MLFITDSLKAMLPEARDEEPEKEPVAIQARCFAAHFPLVKSYIGRKNCAWLVTNHLTINPMAMFQNPESEPGGSSVQFYPDFKLRIEAKRSQSKMITEKTVDGHGEDRYFIGTAKIQKNKFGPSFRNMEYRLWLDSAGTPGMGIDPVYDTFMFLKHCGLMQEKMGNTMHISLSGFEGDITWQKFKAMILSDEQGTKLRNAGFELIRQGKAQELYYEYLKNNPDTKPSKSSKASKGRVSIDDEDDTASEVTI
jgi:RecA/RadA recombinase